MVKESVIIRLSGGIGDQMFQWALAKIIEEVTDMDVSFDKASVKNYQLNVFKIEPKLIEDSLTQMKLDAIWGLRILLHWQKFLGYTFYEEKQFNFDRDINKIKPNTYISGLFQSDLYFKSVEKKLRENFEFDSLLDDANQSFTNQLFSLNSIAIYALSDNYRREGKYKDKYAKCSLDYYKKGVEFIAKTNPDPTLIVFSDNIDWAKKKLRFKYKTIFVSHNKGEKQFEDLRLMSLCSHNIIANDSFSWWGAWLNKNPYKIVVAPQKWFDDDQIIQTDVTPNDWVKLKN